MDVVAESGRNHVSKHQIQPELLFKEKSERA